MNQLPDKLYYTIGEVAKHLGLNTSNLRYWEREFKQLNPIIPFETETVKTDEGKFNLIEI